MKYVPPLVIDIDLLVNNVLRCTFLHHQIQCNILKSKVPSNIERRPSELISFNE
jgi:hypothetical protein